MPTVKYSVSAYIADGTTTDYLITWDYLDEDHITVEVDGLSNADPTASHTFTKLNDTTVRVTDGIGGAITAGKEIHIRRKTPITTRPISFADGSALLAADLNKNSDYLLFSMQEALDQVDFSVQYQQEAEGFRDATQTLQIAASASEVAAAASQVAAAASEAASATNAATVASNLAAAAASETAAELAETNAETAQSAAETAAALATTNGAAQVTLATTQAALATTNGAAQVTLATTQATNSQVSAVASEVSKVASGLSEVASAASEANASSSEVNAATSAANAATSEANSATSEGNAASSATASETSRVASVAAQVASETAKTASQTAQNASEAARDAAAASETAAATSEANAAASEASVSTYTATATTKAGEASTSASNAASSASSAQASKDAALAALDSFDDRYLGDKSSTPTVDNDGNALVAGSLYFDTVSGAMKVYTGLAWVAAYVSGTDYLPLSGGTMTGDVAHGDNVKATFGASADLQVYHDGSASIIQDVGTGDLNLQGTNVGLRKSGAEYYLYGAADGAVTLYHDGNYKLVTTGSGIDVTGTVVADGAAIGESTANTTLTVGGSYANGLEIAQNGIDATSSARLFFDSTTDTSAIYNSGGDLTISKAATINGSSGNKSMTLASNGDISFYEDTGTTPKLTWDASDEALEFGDNVKATFGASSDLQISHDGSNSTIADFGAGVCNIATDGAAIQLSTNTGELMAYFAKDGPAQLYYDNSKKLETTASGISVTGSVDFGNWTITESGGSLYFATGGTNKMKLDASGNLDVVGNVNSNATIS
jgi:hypothetical protein